MYLHNTNSEMRKKREEHKDTDGLMDSRAGQIDMPVIAGTLANRHTVRRKFRLFGTIFSSSFQARASPFALRVAVRQSRCKCARLRVVHTLKIDRSISIKCSNIDMTLLQMSAQMKCAQAFTISSGAHMRSCLRQLCRRVFR
jgi:hypothetical protein